MSTSEIAICNVALSLVGSNQIRSFNESNTRSSMCKVFYNSELLYLLSDHDWSFARRYSTLNKLSDPSVPKNWAGFASPADCLVVRSMDSIPSKKTWEMFGDIIAAPDIGTETRSIIYTSNSPEIAFFTRPFIEVLQYALASKLAMGLAKDFNMSATYADMAAVKKIDAKEQDANIGNEYRDPNNDPNLDSFVNPTDNGHTVIDTLSDRY